MSQRHINSPAKSQGVNTWVSETTIKFLDKINPVGVLNTQKICCFSPRWIYFALNLTGGHVFQACSRTFKIIQKVL